MKKRQKDVARKKKLTGLASLASLSIKRTILEARKLPIYECLVNPSWKEKGLAVVTVSRRQFDDNLVFGVYLVDIFCLGLKNTFCNANSSMWRYQTELRRQTYRDEDPVKCPVSLAHQIIYGAIDFSAQFGFKPNKDFKLSQYVLKDRDAIKPGENVEFGKNGRPFYIAGPDDNVQYVMRQLQSRAGRGDILYHSTELAPINER